MRAWERKTLGDLERESGGTIQTGPFGSQLHMSDYSETGTPVVMPTNIRDLRVDPTGIARVSNEHVKRLARHKLRIGDIVYSRRGDVEKCALITKNEEGWLCGTGCLLVRVQGANLDAKFLSYVLSRPDTRAWISQHAVGATMPNLNTSILREVPVEVPNIETQRAIAGTLGVIDSKIESNRKLAELASELIDAAVSELLAGASTEVRPLADIVEFNRLTVKPHSTPALHYIDIASVSPGRIDSIQQLSWDDAPSRARRGVSDGDVIYSTVRPGNRAFAQILDPHPDAVASTGFAVMTPSSSIGSSILTSVAGGAGFADYLESVAHGSAYPAVSIQAMGDYPVVIPKDAADVERFEAKTMPLRRRVAQARVESDHLADLRDSLIPEVFSGRIVVLPEAGV